MLTELTGALQDPAVSLDLSMLYLYRGLVMARSGRLDQALSDLKQVFHCAPPPTLHGVERGPSFAHSMKYIRVLPHARTQVLVSHPQHSTALQYQVRLEKMIASRDRHAAAAAAMGSTVQDESYTGPEFSLGCTMKPVGSALSDLVGEYEAPCPEAKGLRGVFRTIKRDRPFPNWWQRPRDANLERPASAEEPDEPPPPPSPWDLVLERLDDLFMGNTDDMLRTRRLLLEHADALTEAFVFYCELGEVAELQSDGTYRFRAIVPHRVSPSKLAPAAFETFARLYNEDSGSIRSTMPIFLITLRQFWQLGRDLVRFTSHAACLGPLSNRA
eukprot:SAG11_NODE_3681_length_2288_cov_1.391960_2_plen_329_part_00